jgi:inhibitor of the pro-sigma K processing machinery
MVTICLAFGIFLLFSNQLKAIGKIFTRAAIGCAGLWVINLIITLTGLGTTVGVNPLTALIVGVLGIPGFVSLYITQWIL